MKNKSKIPFGNYAIFTLGLNQQVKGIIKAVKPEEVPEEAKKGLNIDNFETVMYFVDSNTKCLIGRYGFIDDSNINKILKAKTDEEAKEEFKKYLEN